MKPGLFCALAQGIVMLACMNVNAAPVQVAAPAKALLSPNGGRLEVVQTLPVEMVNGLGSVSFVLPGRASNLEVNVTGSAIVRTTNTPVSLQQSSGHSTRRTQLQEQVDQLTASLETANACIALFVAPGDGDNADLVNREALVQKDLPSLVDSRQKLQRQLQLASEELGELPETAGIGQLVTVALSGEKKAGDTVEVHYSYTFPACGWRAFYNFDAQPDDKGDKILVRLMAEVWQYTSVDWTDTEIVLASRGNGALEPAPLPEWRVGVNRPKPQPRAAVYATNMVADGAAMEESAPVAGVSSNPNSLYATWTPEARGLPEGRSRVQLLTETWDSPLEWLARPTRGDTRVWLMTRHRLPSGQAWPAGQAEFGVNGQAIGSGAFNPADSYVTLYFGADPRVNVRTIVDTNKQGETGIINTSRTFTWGWTYIVSNEHNKAVSVRLERPEPFVEAENVTVTYKDEPPATRDSQEHALFWKVEVPAHGTATVKHQVTISAPIKLDLLPDVP